MKKFLSVIMCFSLLFSAASCTPSVEDSAKYYDDIISQYTELLQAKANGEELTEPDTDGMDEREAAIANALYEIVDSCKSAESAEGLCYGFKDMDGNGVLELILMTQYTSVCALFTVSDRKPILLEADRGADYSFVFATKNRFLISYDTVTDNIEESTYYTCRVDGDKMVYDSVCGQVYDQDKKELIESFQIVDGERITVDKETFIDLYREHRHAGEPDYLESIKKEVPRMYFPLRESVTNENLTVADFSSYPAIIKTCKDINSCIEKFNSHDWYTGKYDDLFSFPDNLSFEYYLQLFYATHSGTSFAGYVEVDLNGDGNYELLLMAEDYSIKAIFTKKNGVPVLVDAFNGRAICWLDDQGFIHVDEYNRGFTELEYSIYELAKNGDYVLVSSVLLADTGTRYLTKDGKTEKITLEESLEWRDEYHYVAEPFDNNENTRNVSDITYIPLYEADEENIKTATDKIWCKSADMSEIIDNEYGANAIIDVTFENVTDTQMDVNFKYALDLP